MIEFATLVVISVILLIYFRPGKTPPLNNSLIIERAGQYHIVLSPHLNLAQQFVEAIAQELGTTEDQSKNSVTNYFEIFDKHVSEHGHKLFLLAVTKRDGMLYFQACSPAPGNQASNLNTIKGFSNAILARYPDAGTYTAELDSPIVAAVEKTSGLRNIDARPLGYSS
ncbi:MAG: hypothetical protein V4443_07995 [Pseudomonadota bacterium]